MQAFVGIDVSKEKLDCCWLRDPQSLKVKTKVLKNTVEGIEGLDLWLTKHISQERFNIRVVLEATGIYHEKLAYRLYELGYVVVVSNPAHISAFAKSLGSTHKTDKLDSQVIARYGACQPLQAWEPEAPEIRELKALIARLEAVEKDYLRESNRLET